jgi:lipopolysaccharide/colanic/teichoic acid biosynthesis glycosyltransferase
MSQKPVQLFAKRFLDGAAALFALLLLSPLLVIVAAVIWLKLGSPVFFRQQRPGRGGDPFTIYKFRTMVNARERDGRPLSDAERLPAFGRFLRSTSLDEFPELFNVLKGDMSLVGPRPLMMKYLSRYTPEQARRHEVKPGITGWAQINGRNTVSWEDKFDLDVWYVDNWSVWLDIRIIFRTIWLVVTRQGVTQEGHATVEEFMGTQGNREMK